MSKKFIEIYRAYPAIMIGREDIELSNNIILPPSALSYLSTFLKTGDRLLFQILNMELNLATHCSVLDFTSKEGCCYIPFNIWDRLCLEEGEKIKVEIKNLNICSYIKVRSCTNISNNDVNKNINYILKYYLRNYYCITEGDKISVKFGNEIYKFDILECKPDKANKLIIDSTVIDINQPEDYEPEIKLFNKKQPKSILNKEEILKLYTDQKFKGHHFRIDGKEISLKQAMKIDKERKKDKNDDYDPRKNRIQSNPRPEFKYVEI